MRLECGYDGIRTQKAHLDDGTGGTEHSTVYLTRPPQAVGDGSTVADNLCCLPG